MDTRISIIVKTTTQPGQRAQVYALYRKLMAPRAASNDGQQVVVWSDDHADPDTFYLFEVYRDAGAMATNAQAPWFADYMRQVGPLLAGEPEVSMLTPRWAKGLTNSL